MVDILKFQSITSTQSLIRNPNIFEIFNMNCSKSSFLMIRERSCFQLDNGTFIVKIGLINNLNCLLEFLKQQQQKQIKTINVTVHDFLRHAQRLSLSNDIECKQLHNGSVGKLVLQVHYKHRVERQSSFTHSQLEIDEIDIEQVITDAYHHAVDMLEGLDILNLLEEKHVLELKPLREYLFRQLNSNSNSQKHNYSFQISNIDDEVFESDDDNDEDGNDTTNDLGMNEGNDDSSINNDYTDEDEQNNTQDLINTTKKDFSGVKVADKVEPHIEHTYFKVKLNHDTKCVHKQTACWLLTEEKSKLSNDRLLRVQQVNK
ncbi:unnamed protein product [Rotaria magnacalcarata]|uniref:Uncharacterized protein n=1 Tax=Rotaria magnacalcarata TaxID=392030 RepID=A0A819UUC5_9BILA|nr:unnamed protein product [Rotaria magnacalcarata]CAF4101503.1 unnamed protein product [Rotaria magnacalcarata]